MTEHASDSGRVGLFPIGLLVCLVTLALALAVGAARVFHKGQIGLPALSVSSTVMDFGIRAVGTTNSPGMITLTNAGSGPLTLKSFTVTGENKGDFGLGQECLGTLSAGANCTLSLTFTPAAPGRRRAVISINDYAGSCVQTVILSGAGTALSLSPSSLVFSSSPQSLTVTNRGRGTIHLGKVNIVSPNAADFSDTTTCGATLAAGAECTVSVSLMPKTIGVRTGSLLLSDDSCACSQAVDLMGASGQFMALSADKTHLVDTITNKSVFITGDTAYGLAVQLSSNSDIEAYLSDRQAKGINLIWVALVDATFHSSGRTENDAFGNNPWNGGADFTGMSSATAYWAHVDYVLQRAAAHGIVVLAGTPFAGTVNSCSFPYSGSMASSPDATMTAFGAFLGNRYKSYPNIIWLIGGDANYSLCGSGLANKLNDIAMGIRAVDPVHLMTIEATNSTWGEPSAARWSSYFLSPANPNGWITLGSIYPKGFPSSTFSLEISQIVSQDATEMGSNPFVPYFSIEDPYETEPNEAPYNNRQLRQEGYTEVLGGAYLGRVFGSSAIWPFNASCCEPKGYRWQSDISAAPSQHQQYLGQLFRSREHWKMVPDIHHTVVTAGYGSGDKITVTSRTSDGQTIIAYIPNGNAATLLVDLSMISSSSGRAKGWWFNPSSGAATLVNTFPNSGMRSFTPPDSNDWVLVIDDAAANLPQPGSADL